MSRALTFNTYGGNPLASAVGIAVLDAIEEDGCQEIADTVGTHLLKGFEEIRNEFEVSFFTQLGFRFGSVKLGSRCHRRRWMSRNCGHSWHSPSQGF